MNLAFEQLRSVVPDFPSEECNSKLTKITTLRLAVNYIHALTQILKQDEEEGGKDAKMDSIDGELAIVNPVKDNNGNSTISMTTMTAKDIDSVIEALESEEQRDTLASLIAGLDEPLMMHRPSSCGSSDLPSCSSPSATDTESLQSLESLKSNGWPDFSADDSLDAVDTFDLILESDGESMQLTSDDLIT